MSKTEMYNIPIWLSDWKFRDKLKRVYTVTDVIVKGKNKGAIFTNQKIVDKVVKKIIGARKKHTLKPINLHLKSQHGFGVEEN